MSFGPHSVLGVNGLAIDPQKPNILYARMEMGDPPAAVPGLLKSADGGASWRAVGSDTLPGLSINVLAIDPQDTDILFAQTGPYRNFPGAFFKSRNGGETWSSIPTPGVFYSRTFAIFAIDPQNSNTVYAGGYSGVFKSTDGGMNWEPANTGFPIYPGFTVNALLVHPQIPSIVYAGTSHGLYKSMDGATTWTSVEAGMPPRLFVSSLAFDSQNPGKIYAATSGGGVFATFDSPDLTIDRATYCVGDSWTLNVSNAVPTSTMRLLGTSNGQVWEILQWGLTDIAAAMKKKECSHLHRKAWVTTLFVSRSME